MSTIMHVVGARPNFMKVAPVMAALGSRLACGQRLVHTGQHYDANMSDVFFQQLGLPQPDVSLGVGSGSHAVQTAQIMMRFEEIVEAERPDLVLVYGDVNSTVAAALVCAKLLIPVGHVEAGLRSFDRTMPEEINRLLTDQTAELLFTPSLDGDANLLREGIAPKAIHHVGNVMIDTLARLLPQALPPRIDALAERYALVTLHRPSNVDDASMLRRLIMTLQEISDEVQVVFPMHPRTRARLRAFDIALTNDERLLLLDPLGYLEFLGLQRQAALVITDSGGVQEESTYLQVPCITVRENTERPITVEVGTNVLIGQDMARLRTTVDEILNETFKTGAIPPLWDGKAAERIADVIGKWRQ